jgi:hypothetical protein
MKLHLPDLSLALNATAAAAAMGHPDKITPDVVEWLLADDHVVTRWKSFCREKSSHIRRAFAS